LRNKNSRWVNNSETELFTIDHADLVLKHGYIYGRLPFSKEWREKITKNIKELSKNRIGVPVSEAHKIAMRKPKKDGFREMIKQRIQNEPKYTCPHCNLIVDPRNYARWHGNKCKNKGR